MNSINTVWEKFFTEMVNPVVTLLVIITFTYFLWGLLTFLWNLKTGKASADDIKTGYNHMIWGGAGLFIILSISGILRLLSSFFDGWFS